MRYKRKLWYWVCPEHPWWWVPKLRRWLKKDEIDLIGPRPLYVSNRHCRTFDQAMSYARAVPDGAVTILQFSVRHHVRYSREYYLKR